MKTSCPVCRSKHLNSFLQRASVPVHQNLLFESRTAARSMPFGRLNMTACRECGFVFNSEFDPGLLSYGSSYDNSQHYSPAFVRHLEGLVDRLVNGSGVRNCTIVEVGCGKGDFLRRMAGPPEFGNTGIGFDPAYVGPDAVDDGRTQFRRTFYDAASARFSADVIICRHVIEHIPEPRILLNSVREALQSSPAARVFFETPCVEWILRNQVAWDFFYEHCSIFTAESLSRLFEECGFSVRKVDHVFGGQYLWLEGRLNARSSLRVAATDSAQPILEIVRIQQDFNTPQRSAHWEMSSASRIWSEIVNGCSRSRNCDNRARWQSGALVRRA